MALHRPGTQAARESRPDHESPRRSDGAGAARARLRAGLGQARRLRAARAALERRGLAATRRGARERWSTRSGKLFVVPGDSPLGFRLPLPSLTLSAAVAVSARHCQPIRSSSTRRCRTRIPQRQPFLQRREARGGGASGRRSQRTAPGTHARTAIAVEPRDGRLCVFMPPVAELEDYLDLLAAVEDTSAELDLPIHLEGYEPPRDPRLNVIKVTPDPGVIEVNVQPAGELGRDARDHRRSLRGRALHAARDREVHARRPAHGHGRRQSRRARRRARGRQPVPAAARLAAQLDHLLAAPSRALVSLLGHVHRARRAKRRASTRRGTIRCTSSSSRSSRRIRRAAAGAALARRPLVPQFADRRQRATRIAPRSASTSCIRRTGPTGRLGLVEFRAFEMPPHPRMSLVQQLLLLSLVARFWREPYADDLVRWGTQLHDKFMLPFHVWHDLVDVIDDMNRAGYELDASWFAPHFEFRFPLYGTVELRRHRDRAAPSARAVARARRGGRGRRDRALRRLVGRALAGQGARAHRRPLCRSPATAGACR